MKIKFFAGIGLGLLTGVIIGLSIAEVTGVILGALTSLLAAFFGLRSNKEGETGNHLVIGSFGFTCVISIFLGIYVRTHNLIAPSLETDLATYRAASFDTAEIKKIILFKELGLVPAGFTFSKEAKQLNSSVLMTDTTGSTLCRINDHSTLEEIQEAFDNSSGLHSKIQHTLSQSITDKTALRDLLLLIKKSICQK
jgi:hypothetical protein